MKKGFTLIELLVSVAIVMIISSVIIFNHQKFNDNLEITNLSYEVAVALRQAQVYGVSVREYKGGGTEEERFGLAYGIHFNTNNPTSFVFFADKNKDGVYTGSESDCTQGSPDVCLEKVSIGRGNVISDVCEEKNSKWFCQGSSRDKLDITFLRPEPDAHLKLVPGGEAPDIGKVCLKSPQNKIKEIIVYPTGQISIQDGTCTNQDNDPIVSDDEGAPVGNGNNGNGNGNINGNGNNGNGNGKGSI